MRDLKIEAKYTDLKFSNIFILYILAFLLDTYRNIQSRHGKYVTIQKKNHIRSSGQYEKSQAFISMAIFIDTQV